MESKTLKLFQRSFNGSPATSLWRWCLSHRWTSWLAEAIAAALAQEKLLWNQNGLWPKKTIDNIILLSNSAVSKSRAVRSTSVCWAGLPRRHLTVGAKPNLGKRTSTCSWVTRRSDGSLFLSNWHMQLRCFSRLRNLRLQPLLMWSQSA